MQKLQRQLALLLAKLVAFESASDYLPTKQSSVIYVTGEQLQ